MPRKITVRLVEQFDHKGETYARYQRQDNGACTDIKIMNRAAGVVFYSALAAKAEAERRLRSGRLWRHPHLVR
jgi:hypothetical protein